MTKVLYAYLVKIAPDTYAVCAALGDGKAAYHNGPDGFPYFTHSQAHKLASSVSAAGQISLDHWEVDGGGYYGTQGHEVAMMETETLDPAFQ